MNDVKTLKKALELNWSCQLSSDITLEGIITKIPIQQENKTHITIKYVGVICQESGQKIYVPKEQAQNYR